MGRNSLGGRAELVLPDRFLSAESYIRNVLESVSAPYTHNIGPAVILLHDNAISLMARVIINFLEEHNICVLDWSAQSSDLNPIEQAWDMLPRRVL